MATRPGPPECAAQRTIVCHTMDPAGVVMAMLTGRRPACRRGGCVRRWASWRFDFAGETVANGRGPLESEGLDYRPRDHAAAHCDRQITNHQATFAEIELALDERVRWARAFEVEELALANRAGGPARDRPLRALPGQPNSRPLRSGRRGPA